MPSCHARAHAIPRLGFVVVALASIRCGPERASDGRVVANAAEAGALAESGASADGGASVEGGATPGAGGDCSSNGGGRCGPGLVCERSGGPACLDPEWAEWPMPNASDEVAGGAPNAQSYTDNGDGTVTDRVTGLVWQQLTPPANYTQAQAVAYCAAATLAGRADWRLPSVIELVSIVDTGTYNPSIDGSFFPGTPAVGFYWASTPYAGDPKSGWGVYFNNGYSASNDASMSYSVRCVR